MACDLERARLLQAPLDKSWTPPVAFLLHLPEPRAHSSCRFGQSSKSHLCPGGAFQSKKEGEERGRRELGRRTRLELLGEWAEPPASGGRPGGVCREDLGGERGWACLGWWAGHAGAWGRGENPTRELLESPVAASHFTGEGSGREPIKSECAAARWRPSCCERPQSRALGRRRGEAVRLVPPTRPFLSVSPSFPPAGPRSLLCPAPSSPTSHSSISAVLYLGRPKVPWVRVGTASRGKGLAPILRRGA